MKKSQLLKSLTVVMVVFYFGLLLVSLDDQLQVCEGTVKQAETCEQQGLFAGYYWPSEISLPAWQVNQDGKIVPSARSAQSWPILCAEEIKIQGDKVWVHDDDPEFAGDFFFFRRDIVTDPRLSEQWQEITLGCRDPACDHDCLWEIIAEAAVAEAHPNIVHIIVDDMKRQGLLKKKLVTQMTFEEIREAMIGWSAPVWD